MPDPTPTEGSTVRHRLAEARAAVVGTKGLRTRVAKHAAAISSLRARIDTQQERLARHEQRLKDIETQIKDVDRGTVLDTAERERRDTQFGTIEVRLADLEQRLADAASGAAAAPLDEQQLAEGRGLLDEVRTEHSRIRARMQVISSYEERLRRVEESVAELYDGDRRHPV